MFGNHTAIGCHLANYAYFKKTIARWDADAKAMSVKRSSFEP